MNNEQKSKIAEERDIEFEKSAEVSFYRQEIDPWIKEDFVKWYKEGAEYGYDTAQARIIELEAENKELREALEPILNYIKSTDHHNTWSLEIELAEQALKPKA